MNMHRNTIAVFEAHTHWYSTNADAGGGSLWVHSFKPQKVTPQKQFCYIAIGQKAQRHQHCNLILYQPRLSYNVFIK